MNNNSAQFQIRRKFSLALKPIKILLVMKKNSLSRDDWFLFVQKTKERVLENPAEYLGTDLPDEEMIKDAIEFIFYDFLRRNYRNSKAIEIRMNAYKENK
jgi:hypothetical protein